MLELQELLKIDFSVISHDYDDHRHMESIKFFTDKDGRVLAPLGLGSHIIGWGIGKENITALDWRGSHNFYALESIATPAQHFFRARRPSPESHSPVTPGGDAGKLQGRVHQQASFFPRGSTGFHLV